MLFQKSASKFHVLEDLGVISTFLSLWLGAWGMGSILMKVLLKVLEGVNAPSVKSWN